MITNKKAIICGMDIVLKYKESVLKREEGRLEYHIDLVRSNNHISREEQDIIVKFLCDIDSLNPN